MESITNELNQLRENDPDVALVLDVFAEIERVYRDTLEAMGSVSEYTPTVKNTAEVTISFRPTSPSSDD